jgi:hypothetical protein
VIDPGAKEVDLIIVGSVQSAPPGHVVVGGDVRNELSSARSSVLILPAQTRLNF